MKSLKARVVDDDEQILARMKDRVLDLGHECDAVGSVYEAEGLVQDNQYDYVVLDMELPLRYGDLPSPAVGNQFLNGLRSRFKTLPIFVVTGKEEKYTDLPKDAIFFGATAYFRKPVPTTGPLSLEAAIKKHVVDPLNEQETSGKWLSCEDNGSTVKWKSVAKNGNPRFYQVKSGSIRATVLYRILQHIPDDPLVPHSELKKAGGWGSPEYFPKGKGASKGVIRGHVQALRKELGLVIAYSDFGIIVEQPES